MGDAAQKLLLTTEDAAKLLSLSVPTFRRHVATCVDCVRVGALARWRPEDLAAWRDGPKGGRFDATPALTVGASGSVTKAGSSAAARERRIVAKLSRSRPGYTPR